MKSVVFSFPYLVEGNVERAVDNAMEKFRADLQAAGIEAKKTDVKRILPNVRIAVYAVGGKK